MNTIDKERLAMLMTHTEYKHKDSTRKVLVSMRDMFVKVMREHGIEPDESLLSGDLIDYYVRELNRRN